MKKLFLAVALVGLCSFGLYSDDAPADRYAGRIHEASDEAIKAIKRIRLTEGVQAGLFAAEPMLANPVAFCIDEKGRFYVAETFRLHAGATDNRQHTDWVSDDLASRTVGDRIAMYKKYLKDKFASYGEEEDRIRLVEDTDRDGKADKATVFAGGFRNPADGMGSGVLARNGTVWYTCIPDLWLLRDTNGDGRADVRKSLHTGYGVHVAFLGHDLHGLCIGPDGKIYLSIGDRGLHVETEGRVVDCPDSGAVLRCNPDGSGLELFATGLRNPQELAFDKFGNLFTCDNNCDTGDAARWVNLVPGGDSGWRIGYQYLRSPDAGAWNTEKLWHLPHEGQAAYHLPPLAHIANGPSGLTYHPGTSLLPERYRDHFFLCDFRGSASNSGIHAFSVKPRGAAFELVAREQFAWSILATDCDFGPDGGFYLSDWVDGWRMPFKGRIYKLHEPSRAHDKTVREVQRLLADGMAKRANDELCSLLRHADMRVRREAQFELASRSALTDLKGVTQSDNQLARIHAIWGLGQIGRKNGEAYQPLLTLISDKDAEIRAQAIKVLGEGKASAAELAIVARLQDDEPRVRFFAALSLATIGHADAVPALVEMLRTNDDKDAYLRHAGMLALSSINDTKALQAAADDNAAAVRLAALLAMRRLQSPDVARFLGDVDPRVKAEAARAINDVPINAAMPALAKLLNEPAKTAVPAPYLEPLLFRVLNANFRLGGADQARALAEFAARDNVPEKLQLTALQYLGEWAKPSGRDHIVGLWRPLPERSADEAGKALQASLAGLLTASPQVRAQGILLAAKFGMKEVGPVLRGQATDRKRPAGERIESLQALEALKDAGLLDAAKAAYADDNPRVRHEGRRLLLAKAPAVEAVKELQGVLDTGTALERQGALELLAGLKAPPADAILESWMTRLLDKEAAPEIQLDILSAARQRATPSLKKLLGRYEATRPKDDPVAQYREAILGGDAERGKEIFLHRSEVSCMRCHKLNGQGGEVGPDLASIGKQQPRPYLLEAIVVPNRHIAKGFESVVLVMADGKFHTGIIKSETKNEVRLITPEGKLVSVPGNQIDERLQGKSAMPEDLIRHLSPRDVRDLVEFLSEQKGTATE